MCRLYTMCDQMGQVDNEVHQPRDEQKDEELWWNIYTRLLNLEKL